MIPDGFALTTSLGDPLPAPEVALDNWRPVPSGDVVAEHIAANYWDRPGSPQVWEIARLSQAMVVYRERVSGWTVAAKFYAAKTGDAAEKYAFHRAVSTLRIARNGWLSRLDRTALVAHAAILLIPSGLSGKTAA